MILHSSFMAMGNTAIVELDAPNAGLFSVARRRIEHLENVWSRFLPTSDISRLNAASGNAVLVDPDTALLVQMMLQAYELSSGLFDPTLLHSVVAAGYSHSLPAALIPAPHAAGSTAPHTSLLTSLLTSLRTSLLDVVINDTLIKLPRGLALDPGALGKGLAADLVLENLLASISHDNQNVCVSLGGDIAFAGEPRRIEVLSPFDASPIATVAFSRGGVATSSTTAKTFTTQTGPSHHVIDPRTGAPLSNGIVQATVLASSCAWAEVLATASLVAGHTELVDSLGIGALLVTQHGDLLPSKHWSSL